LLARYQRLDITGGRAVTGHKGHHCGIGKQKAAIGKRNEINSTRAWLVTQGNGIDHIFIVVVFLIDGQVAEALDGIEQQGNPVVLPVLIVKIILGRPRHVFGKAIALVDLTGDAQCHLVLNNRDIHSTFHHPGVVTADLAHHIAAEFMLRALGGGQHRAGHGVAAKQSALWPLEHLDGRHIVGGDAGAPGAERDFVHITGHGGL